MADKKSMFSCDLETTTDPNDCRVWATAYMEIGNLSNYKIGNNFDEFMEWLITSNSICYFHNLKFDGSFIVNYLLSNGWEWVKKPSKEKEFTTIISKMGQWYQILIHNGKKSKKIQSTKIMCSVKKLPLKVAQIAKAFNLPILKGEIDYDKPRPVGYEIDTLEYEYIKNDVEIVARALEIQFNQNLLKMTVGSDALNEFEHLMGKLYKKLFPVFDLELNTEIRQAYRGGFTWLNPIYRNKDITEGIVFDVNSLYPSVMYYKDIPCGFPVEGLGKYEYDRTHPLYIQKVTFEFKVKKDHIPTIQIKNNRFGFNENEYLTSSNGERVTLHVTNVDWQLIQDHYHVYDVEYIKYWKFRKANAPFQAYIDKWMYIKNNSDGAIVTIAKLMLNSLYGKFATNPDITGKHPILNDDGSLSFRLNDEEFREPVYTPAGVFITSYAREVTIRTAQKCYDRIIYCDTDSMHLIGLDIPEAIKDIVDPKKLGYWKNEGQFKRGRFIRQKTYIEEYYAKTVGKDDEGNDIKKLCQKEESDTTLVKVVCAGMSDRVKEQVTFDNFRVGLTLDGNLKPKQVKGGVVLVNDPFSIKAG